jgi:inorganic pyrophosphatase
MLSRWRGYGLTPKLKAPEGSTKHRSYLLTRDDTDTVMLDYKNLPIGENAPALVNAVVEIPRYSTNKYEYNANLGVFRLDRVLHSAVYYSADYGFIPNTIIDDGDPLDLLIFISGPTFPGCVLEVRPIGKLNMVDNKGSDEKILAVAQHDPRYSHIEDLKNVEPHVLKEIEQFFNIYKSLENKLTRTFGWSSKDDALKRIDTCRVKQNRGPNQSR